MNISWVTLLPKLVTQVESEDFTAAIGGNILGGRNLVLLKNMMVVVLFLLKKYIFY